MDKNPLDVSPEERHRRTLEALAEVDAGHLIDHDVVVAWALSLGTDNPLPVPSPTDGTSKPRSDPAFMPAVTSEFTIRLAAARDLAHLAGIERDAQQRYRSVGYDYCADGPVRDPGEHRRAVDEGVVLVADRGGELVGFLMLWPCDGRAHIVEVSVMQAEQGRGIGRALFAAAEDWARAAGYDEATLTTYLDVAWNAPLYRHLGYEDFVPGADRPDLLQVQADEAAWGFARWPRGAMRKRLA